MKEIYETPEFQVTAYESEDIITLSVIYGDNDFADPWEIM